MFLVYIYMIYNSIITYILYQIRQFWWTYCQVGSISTVVKELRLNMFRQDPVLSAQHDWYTGDDKNLSIMII
jgi:hypothetical protein